MSAVAMHVAMKQLELDEDTYRPVLVCVTGKASAREMPDAGRGQVYGAICNFLEG